MKKRVRVYKAGGQSNQATQQQQIVSYLTQKMSSDDFDGDTDALKEDLTAAGITEDVADEYITYVSDDLGLSKDTESVEKQRLIDEEQRIAEEEALLEQQKAEEEQAQIEKQKELDAMYNVDIDMSTTEDTPEDEEMYAKLGGSKPSKRTFIKQYTKYAKMAQGGNTPSPGADDVLNGREDIVRGFQKALQGSAQDAILKQEAEAQYNSAYGAPQIGVPQDGTFAQEGGISNPLNNLNSYSEDTGRVFSNNMYRENDGPQITQFGGFTDPNSGLYKFMGGGDNESADEEYQDSDIDFNQEQYAKGGIPRRMMRKHLEEVNSPYYTATGEAAPGVNLAGRVPTSVVRDRQGLFKPTKLTFNYGNSSTPATNAANTAAQAGLPTQQGNNRRQPVADMMMRSGIPGVTNLGAYMTRSGMAPNVPQVVQPTTPAPTQASNMPYYPPLTGRAQRRGVRDDAQLNRFLGNNPNNTFNDPKEVERLRNKLGNYNEIGKPTVNENTTVPSQTVIPTVAGNNVDQNVVAALDAYKNDPEVLAEVKAKENPEKEPATSSQDEEFCYPGGMCFKLPEEQRLDSQIFNDLPRQLAVHSDRNNKNWLTGEGTNQQLDLSKLNKQDVIDAINGQRTGVNSPFHGDDANYNIDEYAQKWLKFQQDNQREFGNTNYNDLSDPYNTPEGESPGQKYADWLNASGTYDEKDPYNIFYAKGMLHTKEYGGPIDYTEYAYGGDVSIPDLHKYQIDGQVAFDPNANPLSTTVDYKGDTIDFTGKVIKKRDPNFSLDVPELKVPGTVDEDYVNPLTGEKPGVRMGSDGNYVNDGLMDAMNESKDDAYSQDYLLKRNKGDLGKSISKGFDITKGILDATTGIAKDIENRKLENQFLAKDTAVEKQAGVNNAYNVGTYDPNSGRYKANKQGFTGVAKYGGGIYAMGGNTADEDEDIQYMTEPEIKRFLAEGGELEYV